MEAGEILIQSGLLSRQQLERSRTQANGHCDGLRLIESAVNLGFVSEEAALKAVGTAVGLEYIDLAEANVDLSLLKIFPQKLIHRQSLFPIERNNGQLVVARATLSISTRWMKSAPPQAFPSFPSSRAGPTSSSSSSGTSASEAKRLTASSLRQAKKKRVSSSSATLKRMARNFPRWRKKRPSSVW